MSQTPPNPSPVPPPESSASWNLRSQVILCYVLFLMGWITGGFTTLIGFIIALVKRSDAKGTIWHGHFQNLTTVFFAMLALLLIAMFSFPIVLGAMLDSDLVWPFPAAVSLPILLWSVGVPVFLLWYLYRMIKGLMRALDDRAY